MVIYDGFNRNGLKKENVHGKIVVGGITIVNNYRDTELIGPW